MTRATLPRRNPAVITEQVDDETMLIAPGGDALHVLNPTARAIWERLDGSHDVRALATALRAQFNVGPEYDVERDVTETLGALDAKGLLAAG